MAERAVTENVGSAHDKSLTCSPSCGWSFAQRPLAINKIYNGVPSYGVGETLFAYAWKIIFLEKV